MVVNFPARRESDHPAPQGCLAIDRYVTKVIKARPEQDVASGTDDFAHTEGAADEVGDGRGDAAIGGSEIEHGAILHSRDVQFDAFRK